MAMVVVGCSLAKGRVQVWIPFGYKTIVFELEDMSREVTTTAKSYRKFKSTLERG